MTVNDYVSVQSRTVMSLLETVYNLAMRSPKLASITLASRTLKTYFGSLWCSLVLII